MHGKKSLGLFPWGERKYKRYSCPSHPLHLKAAGSRWHRPILSRVRGGLWPVCLSKFLSVVNALHEEAEEKNIALSPGEEETPAPRAADSFHSVLLLFRNYKKINHPKLTQKCGQ